MNLPVTSRSFDEMLDCYTSAPRSIRMEISQFERRGGVDSNGVESIRMERGSIRTECGREVNSQLIYHNIDYYVNRSEFLIISAGGFDRRRKSLI